jgi:hypothetical protein
MWGPVSHLICVLDPFGLEHSRLGRIGVVDDRVSELQRPYGPQVDLLSGDVASPVPQLSGGWPAEECLVTLDGPGERDFEVTGQEDTEVPTAIELGRMRNTQSKMSTDRCGATNLPRRPHRRPAAGSIMIPLMWSRLLRQPVSAVGRRHRRLRPSGSSGCPQ